MNPWTKEVKSNNFCYRKVGRGISVWRSKFDIAIAMLKIKQSL